MDVTAYELRTSYGDQTDGNASGEDQMRTIFKMFNDTGLDEVVGARLGLVNLTSEALSEGLWKTIPKSRVMLGYMDTFDASDKTLALLSEVAAAGYRLALSGNLSADCLGMLNTAEHTVVLDVTKHTPDELSRRVEGLRKFKSKIAASGVDTYDDLEYCKDLNFDFYQGHFLFRPAAQTQSIPVNRMNMLRLLSKLHDPKMEVREIEALISQDVALTYRILQYANSAGMALRSKVNSAGHAVRLIGMETIRSWSSALLLSSVDNKPRELMTSALVRGRMCELLSESVVNAEKESFLSAGLLSVLDALLDCPMEKALSELPLADDIKAALIDGSGPIGKALSCTIAYERADWNNVRFYGLAPASVRAKYMTAIGWSRKLTDGLLN
jgi:EAL and modified HD-GYP domain-containing signal transduction protein